MKASAKIEGHALRSATDLLLGARRAPLDENTTREEEFNQRAPRPRLSCATWPRSRTGLCGVGSDSPRWRPSLDRRAGGTGSSQRSARREAGSLPCPGGLMFGAAP